MYNYLSATLQKAILLCSISTALLLLGIGHLFADGVGRGSVKDDVVPPISTDNLAQKWVGKHLVFLEILKAYDDQEYTDFHVIRPLGVERDKSIETEAGNPVYLQFVGKTVTITKVIACEKDPGSAFQEYSFFLYEATSRTNIEAKTKYSLLHHLALEDWLGIARKSGLTKLFTPKIHICVNTMLCKVKKLLWTYLAANPLL